MTIRLLAVILLAPWLLAGGPHRRGDIYLWVPIDPYAHGGVYFPFGDLHHLLPGVVAVNRPPYVCDVHAVEFEDPDRFIAHLLHVDHLPPPAFREALVVLAGQVHYLGPPRPPPRGRLD